MQQQHSKAADVYSFGIVLWELMTWQVPWEDYNQFQVRLRLLAGTKVHLPALQYNVKKHFDQFGRPIHLHS